MACRANIVLRVGTVIAVNPIAQVLSAHVCHAVTRIWWIKAWLLINPGSNAWAKPRANTTGHKMLRFTQDQPASKNSTTHVAIHQCTIQN